MPAPIDLRKLREELEYNITPENELPAPPEEELLMTEDVAHPGGIDHEAYEPTDESPHGQTLASWEAWEFEGGPEERTNLILFGVALFIGGIIAAFFLSFLFAIFLAVAGCLTASYAFREAKRLACHVTSVGVVAGTRLYEFDSLKSFWITYDPPFSKELVLHSQKTVMPLIRIPLGDHNPLHLREILLRFLREEKHEESLVDTLAKRIGF